MRIGLDFDNTIVSYDSLFYKVALEQKLIPADVVQTKLAVRDYLRSQGKEETWIEMQGYVYGARMAEAETFPGAKEFLRWARNTDVSISIISHKTRHPYLGPQYDLHQAAREWIAQSLRTGMDPLVQPEDIFFELTKEDKMQRIRETSCDIYVDDLPEILLAPDFPASTERLLFDPEGHHPDTDLPRIRSWRQLQKIAEQRWSHSRS